MFEFVFFIIGVLTGCIFGFILTCLVQARRYHELKAENYKLHKYINEKKL